MAKTLATVALMMSTALAQTSTHWLENRGAGPNALTIDVDDTYAVWAWAKSDEQASVTIGKTELHGKFDGPPRGRKPWEWFRLGEVKLDKGPVDVAMGENVAEIAVMRSKEDNPANYTRRVLDEPKAVHDHRVTEERHTDTVFTMPHFESVEQWEALAEKLRRRILISSGLWPMPERTPLNAHVFDRVEGDGFTVEKVYFEARPGFYATGNLYRPIGEGPFPAILNPHGHWEHGRLENTETCSVPARCITFARMGIVAFAIDMVGYNDSLQLEHRWMEPRQKLWGVHPFAAQLWSNIRAVDFLQSLPDVDAERIGCTGASGGGTQTFALMAIDPRIKAAAPVNMISSTMQGGCVCENAPIIRLENSNMEIGALMAPRPLCMISTSGDWTAETPRTEFPAVRSIYQLYNATDQIEDHHFNYGHNYNFDSRQPVYHFFAKHLLKDESEFAGDGPIEEVGLIDVVAKLPSLRVFPDDKLPAGSQSAENVFASWIESNRAKWEAELPKSRDDAPAFKLKHAHVLTDVLGVERPNVNDIRGERISVESKTLTFNDWHFQGGDIGTLEVPVVIERVILSRAGADDAVPVVLYRGENKSTDAQPVRVFVADGAIQIFGRLQESVRRALGKGRAVLMVDPFLTGEHHSPFQETVRLRKGAFHDTFNVADFGNAVQDVLTGLAFVRSRRDLTDDVELMGVGDGGVCSVFAAAIDGEVDAVAAEVTGLNLDVDATWTEKYYAPCIRAVGDVTTAAAMLWPTKLGIGNLQDGPLKDAIKRIYTDAKTGETPGLEFEEYS